MKTSGMARYGGLIALLVVFLAGTGALMALHSTYAQQAASDMAAAGQTGRQQAQPQAILAQTQLARSELSARRYLVRGLNDLRTTVEKADAAFGQLNAGDPKTLEALKQRWTQYREQLTPIVSFKGDPYIETADQGTQLSAAGLTLNLALEEAIRFGAASGPALSDQIGQLTDGLTATAQARADQLRQWMFAGLGASALLLLLMLMLVARISRKERALAQAKRESDDILRTVNQGLFLLDNKLTLGSERSEALENIFRRKDFDKLDFPSLLNGLIPDKTLETANEYVRLLWGDRVNEKLIKSINPLNEVEVNFDAGGGKMETQYLEFDFNRVRGDNSTRVLVTVNDVTRRVELARELHESQEKAQAQLDLLLHILHVEPRQLSAFLEESEVAIKIVNAILKEPAREETAFRAKLDGLFRQVHSVKGEAAALGLKTVESRAHSFEEALSELRNRPALTGNDFLPLVVKLDDLFGHFAQIRDMIGRLSDLRVAMSTETPAAAEPAPTPPQMPVEQMAQPQEEPAAPQPAEEDLPTMIAPSPLLQAPIAQDSGDTLIQRPSAEALEALRQNAAGGDIESAVTQLAKRIARKQSKPIDIHCSGLDRVPAKYRRAIKDIAIQMVRNSLTHGIESPQERSRANKNAAGSIVIRFENQGAEGCEFVCQDDGRGLDAAQLKKTAVERGLISAEQAASLDDRRALSLIFMAGFTTQAEVTEDAGRGVGMDVVRAQVQELGGKIGISTVAGKFLRFRVSFPAASEAQAA